jgi:hypothetical protein
MGALAGAGNVFNRDYDGVRFLSNDFVEFYPHHLSVSTMPGSVQNAAPSGVFPKVLSRSFVQSREYKVEENRYRNGESQRRVDTATSRKTWQFTGLADADLLDELRAFYLAHIHTPFYFYDPFETSPQFSHDPTGAATVGRYTVVFEGGFVPVIAWPRSEVPFSLIEVA